MSRAGCSGIRRIPGATPPERAAIYDAMNDTIATLHAFDPAAIGLEDFGRAEGYVARQVKRWSQQYRHRETQTIPEMDRLIAWLPGPGAADLAGRRWCTATTASTT